MTTRRPAPVFCLLVVVILCLSTVASAQYVKGPDISDVDKAHHGHEGRLTCWLATAANMLAAAGYGPYGWDVQERANYIYTQLVEEYDVDN